MARRHRYGAKRRARRNTWKEPKVSKTFSGSGVTWTVSKAPKHHKAAVKGWGHRAKKRASSSSSKPKGWIAQPRRKSRKPKAHAAVRRSSKPKRSRAKRPKAGSRKKKARRNPSRRRRSSIRRRRNPRSHRIVVRRRRHRKNPRRSHKRARRHSRRNGHRRFRRNSRRRSRRNGGMDMIMAYLPKLGVAALALGAGAFIGSKLSEQVVSYFPTALQDYAPAIVTLLASGGLYMAAKQLKVPEKFMNAVLFGGGLAGVVQLISHVRVTTASGQQSLAQAMGLPFSSIHVDAPAPVQSAAAAPGLLGYGVFGMGRVGNYGVFNGYNAVQGLGGSVDVMGRPIAVEGVVDVPGGAALAVEGVSGYLGSTLSDTVVGTQAPSYGNAENPFAPGLREGQRGTLNEAHASEVADAGSLSGNIFT